MRSARPHAEVIPVFGPIDPTIAAVLVGAGLVLRFVEFLVAIRGAKPDQRAPIIRALRSSRVSTRGENPPDRKCS